MNEVEEIRAIKEELSEEDDKNDGSILVTPHVRDLPLIKRSLHVTGVPYEDSQSKFIFNSRCTIKGMVYGLIVDGSSYTNMAPKTLINKL